jgi:hypothetical protein
MFFARIFSYAQRRRLCALAFDSTREYLARHATALDGVLARHGLTLRHARLRDPGRRVADALTDPRPLHAGTARNTVRSARRDLEHVLAHLERHLARSRAAS